MAKKKKKSKKKITKKERLIIGLVFLLTIALSAVFWLKAEIVYWWQNWNQPEVYHIE